MSMAVPYRFREVLGFTKPVTFVLRDWDPVTARRIATSLALRDFRTGIYLLQ